MATAIIATASVGSIGIDDALGFVGVDVFPVGALPVCTAVAAVAAVACLVSAARTRDRSRSVLGIAVLLFVLLRFGFAAADPGPVLSVLLQVLVPMCFAAAAATSWKQDSRRGNRSLAIVAVAL